MLYDDIVSTMDEDPTVLNLLRAPIHARLAYVARDGTPRAIPIGYVWTGKAFVFATGPGTPKVNALMANPKVALTIDSDTFPPNILLVRGDASLETVTGVPDEHIEASRRFVGEDRMADWEASVRRDTDAMVVVTITPTWIKMIDFVRTFPGKG